MHKAIFDGYATKYDQWFMANQQVFLSELKLLKATLTGASTERVLSIGCGSGLFEDALHRHYSLPLFDGIEPSTDMAAIAKKRGLNVTISTAEAVELPADTYDVIYFNGSSSYIKDLKFAYQHCLKALKPGGRFISLDIPLESAYGMLYHIASSEGSYDSKYLRAIAPAHPYPVELTGSFYSWTARDKKALFENELQLINVNTQQTLLANPLYTNDFVEEPVAGFRSGGYVAIMGQKQ